MQVQQLLHVQASLEELNSRLDDRVPMDRFRPNIVVNGQEPWAEDTWQKLSLGDVPFEVNMPNGRCKVCIV